MQTPTFSTASKNTFHTQGEKSTSNPITKNSVENSTNKSSKGWNILKKKALPSLLSSKQASSWKEASEATPAAKKRDFYEVGSETATRPVRREPVGSKQSATSHRPMRLQSKMSDSHNGRPLMKMSSMPASDQTTQQFGGDLNSTSKLWVEETSETETVLTMYARSSSAPSRYTRAPRMKTVQGDNLKRSIRRQKSAHSLLPTSDELEPSDAILVAKVRDPLVPLLSTQQNSFADSMFANQNQSSIESMPSTKKRPSETSFSSEATVLHRNSSESTPHIMERIPSGSSFSTEVNPVHQKSYWMQVHNVEQGMASNDVMSGAIPDAKPQAHCREMERITRRPKSRSMDFVSPSVSTPRQTTQFGREYSKDLSIQSKSHSTVHEVYPHNHDDTVFNKSDSQLYNNNVSSNAHGSNGYASNGYGSKITTTYYLPLNDCKSEFNESFPNLQRNYVQMRNNTSKGRMINDRINFDPPLNQTHARRPREGVILNRNSVTTVSNGDSCNNKFKSKFNNSPADFNIKQSKASHSAKAVTGGKRHNKNKYNHSHFNNSSPDLNYRPTDMSMNHDDPSFNNSSPDIFCGHDIPQSTAAHFNTHRESKRGSKASFNNSAPNLNFDSVEHVDRKNEEGRNSSSISNRDKPSFEDSFGRDGSSISPYTGKYDEKKAALFRRDGVFANNFLRSHNDLSFNRSLPNISHRKNVRTVDDSSVDRLSNKNNNFSNATDCVSTDFLNSSSNLLIGCGVRSENDRHNDSNPVTKREKEKLCTSKNQLKLSLNNSSPRLRYVCSANPKSNTASSRDDPIRIKPSTERQTKSSFNNSSPELSWDGNSGTKAKKRRENIYDDKSEFNHSLPNLSSQSGDFSIMSLNYRSINSNEPTETPQQLVANVVLKQDNERSDTKGRQHQQMQVHCDHSNKPDNSCDASIKSQKGNDGSKDRVFPLPSIFTSLYGMSSPPLTPHPSPVVYAARGDLDKLMSLVVESGYFDFQVWGTNRNQIVRDQMRRQQSKLLNACSVRAYKSKQVTLDDDIEGQTAMPETRLFYTDTPLIAASRNGHARVVRWLLSSEVVDPTLESFPAGDGTVGGEGFKKSNIHNAVNVAERMFSILNGTILDISRAMGNKSRETNSWGIFFKFTSKVKIGTADKLQERSSKNVNERTKIDKQVLQQFSVQRSCQLFQLLSSYREISAMLSVAVQVWSPARYSTYVADGCYSGSRNIFSNTPKLDSLSAHAGADGCESKCSDNTACDATFSTTTLGKALRKELKKIALSEMENDFDIDKIARLSKAIYFYNKQSFEVVEGLVADESINEVDRDIAYLEREVEKALSLVENKPLTKDNAILLKYKPVRQTSLSGSTNNTGEKTGDQQGTCEEADNLQISFHRCDDTAINEAAFCRGSLSHSAPPNWPGGKIESNEHDDSSSSASSRSNASSLCSYIDTSSLNDSSYVLSSRRNSLSNSAPPNLLDWQNYEHQQEKELKSSRYSRPSIILNKALAKSWADVLATTKTIASSSNSSIVMSTTDRRRNNFETILRRVCQDDSSLTRLKLDGVLLEPSQWQRLFGALENNSSVEKLSLRNCQINDDILFHLIVCLVDNDFIKRVDLRDNLVSNDSALRLLKVIAKNNSSLSELKLSGNREIEEDTFDKFHDMLYKRPKFKQAFQRICKMKG